MHVLDIRGRPKYVTKKECNCEATHPCPLESKCNRNDVVYKAEISSTNIEVDKSYYIGGAKHFKQRYANHLTTFRNKNIQQECSLKDFVWDLKDRGISFTIKWQILKESRSYKAGDNKCTLCLDEKLYILENSNDRKLINKDIQNMERCRHKSKFLVLNWKKRKEKVTTVD